MRTQRPVLHARDHMAGGADPVPGLLPSLPTDLLPAGFDAFWKLDEPSGTVAHDSSGHGWHLQTPSGHAPPSWGEEAGPPGTVSAGFAPSIADGFRRTDTPPFPAYDGDFTAAGWVNLQEGEANVHYLIGQGRPSTTDGDGWALEVGGRLTAYGRTALLKFNDGAGPPTDLSGVNNLTTDGTTWYMLAVVRHGGDFSLYVNGLEEATTTAAFTAAGGIKIAEETETSTPSQYQLNGLGSWFAVWGRALSGTELFDYYQDPAGAGGDWVLGTDENGDPVWRPPDDPTVTVNGDDAPNAFVPQPPWAAPPDDPAGLDPDLQWMTEQPFTWNGPEFDVPPKKWTTIPFTHPLMERQSNVAGGSTTWFELDWDDAAAAGWIDPDTPRVITIPHDMPFFGSEFDWMQICLKLEIPAVEEDTSARCLRIFETTHQKPLVFTGVNRSGCTTGHGALDVFRDQTAHGLTADGELFAWGDPGGEHDLEHGNIMFMPNSDIGYYLPGLDWLPGHAAGNPTLTKGMRLVPQVWHDASETLTFDCSGTWPYRPHFVVRTMGQRSWGPPWSDWPEA